MKQETITRIKLIASPGMVITNGEAYGTIIYLASDANPSDWYEITEEEAERLQEEVNKEDE